MPTDEWQAGGEQDTVADDHSWAGVVEAGRDQLLADRTLTAGRNAGREAADAVCDSGNGTGALARRVGFDGSFRGEAVRVDLFDRLGRPRVREAPALEDEGHGSCDEQQAQYEDEDHGSIRP